MISAPLSAAREAWDIATRGYAGEPRLKLLKQQLRWAFAAAVNAGAAREWFRILRTPGLSMYEGLNPRMALKPFRVYISNEWDIEQKIKTIKDTYRFIQSIGPSLQSALTRREGVDLARFVLAQDCSATVQLWYENTYRKEGELVASLCCHELGGVIISLAFSFEQRPDGDWVMYIGCIQGRTGVDNKPISKAMHGLWPRVFIVFAAQEIASSLGITHILGVGNGIHSHKNKHIIHIATHHGLTFDYDALWEEVGGKPVEGGWFAIPAQLERRPYESMKSNKRSMYTRRYAMLDDVSAQIRTSLPQSV